MTSLKKRGKDGNERERGAQESERRRKRMLGDNLIMSFCAIFSPESYMATGLKA